MPPRRPLLNQCMIQQEVACRNTAVEDSQRYTEKSELLIGSFPEGLLLVAMTTDLATPESALGRMLQRIYDAVRAEYPPIF